MSEAPTKQGFVVTVVGLGNIGSFVVPVLAKLPGLGRVVLVDRDRYEPGNFASQRMARRDIGMPKAFVQARLLRALNPELATDIHHADVRELPPGRLRADVIISGVDSLEARLLVNQLAWGLGIPWLDAGVAPTERLVRVSGFLPGPDAPCYECALGDSDYRTLSSRAPCERGNAPVAATNAPAQLGALAAALLVAELAKVLAGRGSDALLSRQLVFGTEAWPHFVSKLVRNPLCRFGHRSWQLIRHGHLTPRSTLAEVFAVAAALGGAGVRVPGKSFARAVRCPRCGAACAGLHLLGSNAVIGRNCAKCGRERVAAAEDLLPELTPRTAEQHCALRLADLGLQAGEILEVTGAKTAACVELSAVTDENSCEVGNFSSKSRRILPPTSGAPAVSEGSCGKRM